MQEIQKRLRPLMIADFFAGLMFFYPVTFPLMHRIGLTASQMSVYALVSSVSVLAIEIPSGILADRWSRKNVIILGLILIGVGAGVIGQAHNLGGFIVGAIFVSAYFAMRSGIQEAIIYDVLLEQDQRKDFEHQLGRLRAYSTVGNVISSLLGAFIAASVSFKYPYYLSCISCAFRSRNCIVRQGPQSYSNISPYSFVL
jgi:MFS family permease